MTNEAAWNVTPHSDSRMNRMTNIPNSGTTLAGLDKTKHGLLICTSDGSGLFKDHVYLCNADGDSLIDLMGAFEVGSIFQGNPKFTILQLTQTNDLLKAQWNQTVTTTGTIEDKTDGTTGERSIRLRPNLTSGASATITYPHLKLDFSKTATYQTKLQIETATNIAFHTGVGCDDVTSVDTNTRKFQAEVCTVTNNNWWLRTANGTANSSSDSGIVISANRVAVRINFLPDDGEADLQIDTGTLLQKTSNIPTSGATADNNIIKHSVKNSTGADRPLLVYGSRLSYTVSDNWV
jgi:hypothetical protein